jgi:outer membrane protein OmpA-like peptidoglycan-associated protein
MKVALLKGLVRDADTKQPVEAKIELVDLTKDEKIGNFMSDGSSGKYLVSLPSGRNYGAVVQASGYLFASDNFNLPDTADYVEYTKIFDLVPVKVGSTVVLNNIFFETAKWDLKKESTNELDRLLAFIKANPKMKIEIGGHTDNVGKDEYNQNLSEKRSEAVVKYLTSKGIPIEQLQFHGYGEKKPVSTNDTPEGRQANRRTEFQILAN